jgi:hypothetical protein
MNLPWDGWKNIILILGSKLTTEIIKIAKGKYVSSESIIITINGIMWNVNL